MAVNREKSSSTGSNEIQTVVEQQVPNEPTEEDIMAPNDAPMTIIPEPKKLHDQSQGSEPQSKQHLPLVQETQDQPTQDINKISVRFLSGEEAFVCDRGITAIQLRVAVANKLEWYAPRVKIYCFSTGKFISENVKADDVPPKLFVVVDPNLVFNDKTWKEAIELHGKAADIDGVRRVVAAVDAREDGGVRGIYLVTDVFWGYIGSKMNPLLRTLLEVGVDVHRLFNGVDQCLIYACCCRNIELVSLILKAGGDVDHKNDGNFTCLMVAIGCGTSLQLIELLIEAGANINDENVEGETSLIIACKNMRSDVVERLLIAGADVNCNDMSGTSALGIAQKNGDVHTVSLLLNAGAHFRQ